MAMSTIRLLIVALMLNTMWYLALSTTFNWGVIGNTEATPDTVMDTITGNNKYLDAQTSAEGALSNESKKTVAQAGSVVGGGILGNMVEMGTNIMNLFLPIAGITGLSYSSSEIFERLVLLIVDLFRAMINIILAIDIYQFIFNKKTS